MENEKMRIRVRLLKARKNISYKAIADKLGIKQRSIYNWLRADYNFSAFSLMILDEILTDLESD